MACSTRPGKFFKLSSLILDIGTKSLVFKLRDDLQKAGLTFQGFLSFHKHELFHLYEKRRCCQCQKDRSRSYWTRAQWLKLFDESSSPCSNKGECMCRHVVVCQTEEELDISLLSSILLHACSLTPAERQDIINLRNQRNEFFAHARTAELEEAVYQKGLDEATDSIKSIAHSCRDRKLYDEIEGDIENLIQSPFDDKLCRHVISMLPFVTENAEKLVEEVRLMVQEVEKKNTSEIENITKEIKRIKSVLNLPEQSENDDNPPNTHRNIDMQIEGAKIRKDSKDSVVDAYSSSAENLQNESAAEGKVESIKQDYLGFPKTMTRLSNTEVKVLHGSIDGTFDEDQLMTIHVACNNGHVDILKYHLEQISPNSTLLNAKNPKGYNVLHLAARSGNLEIFKLVVSYGVNAELTTSKNQSILHLACGAGKSDICRYIVENYPDIVNAEAQNGDNAAYYAVRSGNVNVLEMLHDIGINMYRINNLEQNILHIACVHGMFEMCQYIISQYPDMLHTVDNDGWNTALHAAQGGNVQILKLLKDNSVNMAHANKHKWNILHVACKHGTFEMCQYIISQYPDMLHTVDNDDDNTALHAARGGNVQILELLKDNSVNLTHASKRKRNILHVACSNGRFEMCSRIISQFSDMISDKDIYGWNSAQITAYFNDNIDSDIVIIDMLAENGLDIYSVTVKGNTVLTLACERAKIRLCEHLIQRYPRLLDIRGSGIVSPKVAATSSGSLELVKIIDEVYKKKGENTQ